MNSVVFLDLKKAFDTVNHSILLSKLNAYGFGCSTNNWFASYLHDRSQKCFVNNHLSDYCTLLCGIPQGTILGPLLFLIYINDLPNCLEHSKPRMYADDIHLTFASNNVKDMNLYLNQDLAKVNEWLVANKLTLNQSVQNGVHANWFQAMSVHLHFSTIITNRRGTYKTGSSHQISWGAH